MPAKIKTYDIEREQAFKMKTKSYTKLLVAGELSVERQVEIRQTWLSPLEVKEGATAGLPRTRIRRENEKNTRDPKLTHCAKYPLSNNSSVEIEQKISEGDYKTLQDWAESKGLKEVVKIRTYLKSPTNSVVSVDFYPDHPLQVTIEVEAKEGHAGKLEVPDWITTGVAAGNITVFDKRG